MNDLAKMSVEDLISEFHGAWHTSHVSSEGDQYWKARDAVDDLARRIAVMKDEWYSPKHMDSVEERTIKPLRERAEQAEAALEKAQSRIVYYEKWYSPQHMDSVQERTIEPLRAALEQMTARCAVLVGHLNNIADVSVARSELFTNDADYAINVTDRVKWALSNLPASVEKLLAIKRAAEAWERDGVSMRNEENLIRAVRTNRETP